MNPYQERILKVTKAPKKILGILENIMRDDIFHSTLDWQTPEQFDQAAREAFQFYQSNPEMYETSGNSEEVPIRIPECRI